MVVIDGVGPGFTPAVHAIMSHKGAAGGPFIGLADAALCRSG